MTLYFLPYRRKIIIQNLSNLFSHYTFVLLFFFNPLRKVKGNQLSLHRYQNHTKRKKTVKWIWRQTELNRQLLYRQSQIYLRQMSFVEVATYKEYVFPVLSTTFDTHFNFSKFIKKVLYWKNVNWKLTLKRILIRFVLLSV